MKFSAVAAAAFVAGAQAASNVTYTTEVVTAYTTYCPAATQITHNGETYTVTSATTLTITNCPCTISKPVYSTSAPAAPSSYPVSSAVSSAVSSYPVSSAPGVSSSAAVTSAKPSAPVYPTGANSTIATVPTTKSSVGTTSATVVPSSTASSTSVPTAGAGKAAALSGAGLAGVLGLVAYVL